MGPAVASQPAIELLVVRSQHGEAGLGWRDNPFTGDGVVRPPLQVVWPVWGWQRLRVGVEP